LLCFGSALAAAAFSLAARTAAQRRRAASAMALRPAALKVRFGLAAGLCWAAARGPPAGRLERGEFPWSASMARDKRSRSSIS